MVFKEIGYRLKDGRDGVLRSPSEDDAQEMLQYIKTVSGETDFLTEYPEEYDDFALQESSRMPCVCRMALS